MGGISVSVRVVLVLMMFVVGAHIPQQTTKSLCVQAIVRGDKRKSVEDIASEIGI